MRLVPRLPPLTPTLAAYIALLVLLLWSAADRYAPYHGAPDTLCRISYVYDGDTVEMMCGAGGVTARLQGLNAPETRDAACAAEAALGARATTRLREVLRGGAVQIYRQGYEKYGRDLVVVTVGGEDVADLMIFEGLAERYTGGKRRDWCQ